MVSEATREEQVIPLLQKQKHQNQHHKGKHLIRNEVVIHSPLVEAENRYVSKEN